MTPPTLACYPSAGDSPLLLMLACETGQRRHPGGEGQLLAAEGVRQAKVLVLGRETHAAALSQPGQATGVPTGDASGAARRARHVPVADDARALHS